MRGNEEAGGRASGSDCSLGVRPAEAESERASGPAKRLEDVEKIVRNQAALIAELLECVDYLLLRDLELHGPDTRIDGVDDAT
jgi:hypothetical protein